MNIFILWKDGVVVGVYETRQKARDVRNALNVAGASRATIERRRTDYAHAEVAAGESLWQVSYKPATDTTPDQSAEIGLEIGLDQDDFQYDSRTRRYTVAVFAADQAAAELEAEALRAAFVLANGL